MTVQQNVINDLGTVTKVPNKIINALIEKLNLCIGSAIHDAILTKEDMVQINVGIGILSVNIADMQCKFIPSKSLKAAIKRGVTEKIDPLEFELEQALIAKLCNICDEEI